MKVLLIVLDGMADERTVFSPLNQAFTPAMDKMAREGRCGLLQTIPDGMYPGSEVANLSILGYDVRSIGEGRAYFEALGRGIDVRADECIFRCNFISLDDNRIIDFAPEGLTELDQDSLICSLNSHLSDKRMRFMRGRDYRHFLLMEKDGVLPHCTPPQDIWNEEIQNYLPHGGSMGAYLKSAILNSRAVLSFHPLSRSREFVGKSTIDSIWPWSPSVSSSLPQLSELHPNCIHSMMVTGVDIMKGIGRCVGMSVPDVKGATGSLDTNYEAKVACVLDGIDANDLVYLHIEATDEAGHKGDGALKTRCIEEIDKRVLSPLFEHLNSREDIVIGVLPDHPTPFRRRRHSSEPVPFLVWKKNIEPDRVERLTELSVESGSYGMVMSRYFLKMLFL